MERDIDWYIGLMDELDEEFSTVVDLFEAIDDMVRPTWSLPAEFTAVIKDVMAVVDTAPSDTINSGAIALSGSVPIFNVSPFAANQMEYDRAQTIEEVLTYQFKRSNKRGNGTVMYDIADSSLRYNTICVQTHDLAHILPKDRTKWNHMQKVAWGHGRFIDEVHNPKNVRYTHSTMGLTFVGYSETMRVKDALDHWALFEGGSDKENKKISQTLKDLTEAVGLHTKAGMSTKDIYFTQSYAVDYDKLAIWGSLTDMNGEDLSRVNRADYIFADQANPYGFLPWSVRVAGSRLEKALEYRVNPLLAPLYWSKSWDKLNLAKSIIFSEPIRRARQPRGVSTTLNGEPVRVDYEQGSDIALRQGEGYTPFTPITLDANALAVVNALESAMNRTTGASMIGDTTKISSNTPFSTFSAMVKVALSRLDKQREIMADSVVDMQCNRLYWVGKTGIPLEAYAEQNKQYRSGTMKPRGSKMEVMKEDFDYINLNFGISAKIRPSTPTDQMEQLNMAILMSTKLNYPVSMLLEEIGYENVGLAYELWAQEFIKSAEVQAQAAGLQAEAVGMANVKVQQAMQAAAQPPQPPPGGAGGAMPPGGPQGGGGGPLGAGGDVSQQAFGALGGQEGFNPAMGGSSPMQGAPTQTREAVTGRNRMQR